MVEQVGGTHYQKLYQHWDFVCDTELHYLLGCATKYIDRWEDKNGIQDLKKVISYLDKAVERRVVSLCINYKAVDDYCIQFDMDEQLIIRDIHNNAFESAKTRVAHLIAEEQERLDQEAEASSGYVDQD